MLTDSTFCTEDSERNEAASSPDRKKLQPQPAPERFNENY